MPIPEPERRLYTWEVLQAAVVGWGENEGQLTEDEIERALGYIDSMKDEPEVLEPLKPECSICRRRHGTEVIHACE